jgi:uncharacterized protein (DUF488 family)
MIRTIGHSNHPIEHFLDLLKKNGVKLLVDVRSMPYSRRFPQYARERLSKSLSDAGIDYRWEGEGLGGMTKGVSGLNEAADRAEFRQALDRVIQASLETPLCLMCAEKEPMDCHRTVLVSRRLVERGEQIAHLLADGTTRAHAFVEEALLAKAGGRDDLFEDRAERLGRAYDARERAMKKKG